MRFGEDKMLLNKDVQEVLLSTEQIKEICQRLGKQISQDYKDKNLLVVGILKGSVPFMADLLREIDIPCQIDFMAISSYHGAKTTGNVQFKKDLDIDPDGFDILVVEDILDTGISLKFVSDVLLKKNANSVKICTFIDKPANRVADIKADYVGYISPDAFLVGYGLDYNEKYRNLPYLAILKPEIYSK